MRPWLGAALVIGAVAAACSASSTKNEFGSGGAGGGSSQAANGSGGAAETVGPGASGVGGFDPTTTATGAGGGSDDCPPEAKLVYVVGEDNALYSFYPPTLELKNVGFINCPNANFATPFSMAVDRTGFAWVLFSDGNLYRVDVKTAACQATAYVPGQQGFQTFGMGFVTNAANSTDETLYVADYFGTGLAKIDTKSLQLTVVGPYDKESTGAELTGTGDAHLWGFFETTPIVIAEIDKSNAKILSQWPQATVSIGSGWAFAFWGGDFWLFTCPNGSSSQIDRWQPMGNSTTTVKSNIGSVIVGAGVSTCAPFVPPN